MIGRQRKHVQDLENALIRIHNKRFGICIVTGQLIDKRRLMAVPTTTKSLEAKTTLLKRTEQEKKLKKKPTASKAPTSFSRVIKRTGGVPAVKPAVEKDDYFDDDEDDNDLDDELNETENLDLDSIVDESTSIE